MFGFLRSRWFWVLTILAVVIVGGGLFMKNKAAANKKTLATQASQTAPSPYAAIANGKADVEGGIIQVAARRGGVVKAVFVQEGDRVVSGQILARQEDDDPRLAVGRARAQVAQAQAQIGVLQVKLGASRRELASGGLPEQRVLRVQGLASSLPLEPADPTAPANRRISIIVMNRDAEDRMLRPDLVAAAGAERASALAQVTAAAERLAPSH